MARGTVARARPCERGAGRQRTGADLDPAQREAQIRRPAYCRPRVMDLTFSGVGSGGALERRVSSPWLRTPARSSVSGVSHPRIREFLIVDRAGNIPGFAVTIPTQENGITPRTVQESKQINL